MFSPASPPHIVPPSHLIILDSQQGPEAVAAAAAAAAASATVSANSWETTVVGPYQEGNSFNITCLASGGIPAPRVSWWRSHALLDDSFEVLPDGTVKNVLFVSKLSRRDLFTVSNFFHERWFLWPNLFANFIVIAKFFFFAFIHITSWHCVYT